MIFTIGLVLFLIACVAKAHRDAWEEIPMWEAATGCGGLLLMVISLCIVTWRALP